MNIGNKNGIISLVVYSVIFGLLGGIVGDLVIRSYFSNSLFPLSGEINYSDNNYKGTNLIIRDAKKVVVEQSEKSREVRDKVSDSLVAVFKKKPDTSKNLAGSDSYYFNYQKSGEGIVMTSDGWIISAFKNFKDEKDLIDNYVIITKDKKVYPINKIVTDKLTKFNFIHIGAKDLPIKGFADINSPDTGDMVVAVNWEGSALLSQVTNKLTGFNQVRNSDNFIKRFETSNDVTKKFKGACLFDLSGNLAGLIDGDGAIDNISNFVPVIRTLLKSGVATRTSLGVTFVNANELVGSPYKSGDLIESVTKGSPADLAGLKSGYVIVSVDGNEINGDYDLNDVLRTHAVGDNLLVKYSNKDISKEVSVVLKEFVVEK